MDLDKFAMEVRSKLQELHDKVEALRPRNPSGQFDASAHNKIQAVHDRLTAAEQQIKDLLTPSNTAADAPQTDQANPNAG